MAAGIEKAVVPTRFWHALEDGRLQCDLCPRFCKLKEGKRGLCFVRANRGGQIVLTTYGRSSGYCVDPIEKKPLFHFLPGTPVLSFGTAGCNLACRFCQNWDISKARQDDLLADRADPAVLDAVQVAAERAYRMAEIGPGDVDVAEVHDCFAISEICCVEALGICDRGQGNAAAML